jgi:hypothetical protein
MERELKQADNQDYTLIRLPKLNHWFQACTTGALAEYGSAKETWAPEVLQLIAEWLSEKSRGNHEKQKFIDR